MDIKGESTMQRVSLFCHTGAIIMEGIQPKTVKAAIISQRTSRITHHRSVVLADIIPFDGSPTITAFIKLDAQ